MADFYAGRGEIIPPLPWQTFAPPFSLILGYMHAVGSGVAQDFIQAHMWFSLSAALGCDDAVPNRDEAARRLTANQLTEAQRLAMEWSTKARRNG